MLNDTVQDLQPEAITKSYIESSCIENLEDIKISIVESILKEKNLITLGLMKTETSNPLGTSSKVNIKFRILSMKDLQNSQSKEIHHKSRILTENNAIHLKDFLISLTKEQCKNYGNLAILINTLLENCQNNSQDLRTIKNVLFDAWMPFVFVYVRRDLYGKSHNEIPVSISDILGINIKKAKELEWPVDRILDTLLKQLMGQLEPGDLYIEEELYAMLGGYHCPVYVPSKRLEYLKNAHKDSIDGRTIPVKNPYSDKDIPKPQILFSHNNNTHQVKKFIVYSVIRDYMGLIYSREGGVTVSLNANTRIKDVKLKEIFSEYSQLRFGKSYCLNTGEDGKKSVINFLIEMNSKASIADIHKLLLQKADENPNTNREALFLEMHRKTLQSQFVAIETIRGPMLVRDCSELKDALIHAVHYHYMYLSNIKNDRRGFFANFMPQIPSVVEISRGQLGYHGKPGWTENGKIGRKKMALFLQEIVKCESITTFAKLLFDAQSDKSTLADGNEHNDLLNGQGRLKVIHTVLCQNALLELTENGEKRYETIYDHIISITTIRPENGNALIMHDVESREKYIEWFGNVIIKQLFNYLRPDKFNCQELAFFVNKTEGKAMFGISEEQIEALEIYEKLHAELREKVEDRVTLQA